MSSEIKFLVMDVDGTLTDGKIYMGENGELFKAFDIKDGYGIKEILPKYDIVPVIITARESLMLANRCKELGIVELHQSCRGKLKKLKEVIERYSDSCNYSLANVAYVGDDLLDLKCMNFVKAAGGLVVCPNNAIKELQVIADYICNKKCGEGAIREFIDWYTAKVDGRGFEKVYDISPKAYEFIKNFNPSLMKDGKYDLGNGMFANVMTYTTKPLMLSSYEAHKKHIDIQYIIYGTEVMITEDVCKFQSCNSSEYDLEKDTTFYNYNSGNVMVLDSGDAVILYPDDAHRGAVAVEKPVKTRKIVVKVPI